MVLIVNRDRAGHEMTSRCRSYSILITADAVIIIASAFQTR